MALFPFFREIQGLNGYITGGGKHALEKIQKLLPYGPRLSVFAQEFCEEIKQIQGIELIQRKFEEQDLEDRPGFVIVAGENLQENHWIAQLCKERRILVNVVDDPAYCDFIFPSLVRRGNLSIGLSTGGTSPAAGVLLKRKIEEQIPDCIEEILDFLQEKRPVVSRAFPDKKERTSFFYRLSELCMALGRPLTQEEFERYINSSE